MIFFPDIFCHRSFLHQSQKKFISFEKYHRSYFIHLNRKSLYAFHLYWKVNNFYRWALEKRKGLNFFCVPLWHIKTSGIWKIIFFGIIIISFWEIHVSNWQLEALVHVSCGRELTYDFFFNFITLVILFYYFCFNFFILF